MYEVLQWDDENVLKLTHGDNVQLGKFNKKEKNH